MSDARKSNRIRRLKYIEAFSAVVSTGSISAAARQLGVSQPAVSHLIKNLEQAVGAPLFVRRNGAIFPTARAENLREDAIELLARLDRFQTQLNYRETQILNTIRITATLSITNEILPHVISEIHAQHPEAKFYVSSIPLTAMIDSLTQSHVDFAFHTRPLEHPQIRNEVLTRVRQVAVMPKTHPLAEKDVLEIDDIRGCKLVGATRNDPSYRYYSELWQRHKVPATQVLQSPFASLSMQMVHTFQALSFNNEIMARSACLKDDRLTWKFVDGIEETTTFFLALADWQYGGETHKLVEDCFRSSLQ
ncbi:LysR substrate-binding domain-containing protein [Cognatishimia sp.]|uniref:LysR family transcriptional regulator n=1 Tax=Cognatishimia sp. TaxID=2211648 RepID=UPI0035176F41